MTPDRDDSSRSQRHCLEVTNGNRTSCYEIHVFQFKGRWTATAYGPEGEPIEFFMDQGGFIATTVSAELLEEALEKCKQYVLKYLTDSRWQPTGKEWGEEDKS